MTTEEKVTPVHQACYYDNEKAVMLLLDHGARLSVPEDLVSPIVKLCTKGNMDNTRIRVLKLLVQHGANVNSDYLINSWSGVLTRSVLISCIYQLRNVGRITGHDERKQVLLFLKGLINSGADVNYVDSQGRNSLHIACYYHGIDVTELLIENGGDYKIRDNRGLLPIDHINNSMVEEQYMEIINRIECR